MYSLVHAIRSTIDLIVIADKECEYIKLGSIEPKWRDDGKVLMLLQLLHEVICTSVCYKAWLNLKELLKPISQ